jgi:hypothetical protein
MPSFTEVPPATFVRALPTTSWKPIPGLVQSALSVSLQHFFYLAGNSMDNFQADTLTVVQHLWTKSPADKGFRTLLPQRSHKSKRVYLHDIDFSSCRCTSSYFRHYDDLGAPIEYRRYAGAKNRDSQHSLSSSACLIRQPKPLAIQKSYQKPGHHSP